MEAKKICQENQYQKPDRRAIKAWRLRRFITLIFLIIILAGLLVSRYLLDPGTVMDVVCGIAGVLVLYKIVGLFVYPLIEYKQWKFLISDEKVEIIHGIFFIERNIIPVIRIQNITIQQGPIYRKFDLHTVEVALASGTFEIEGLSREIAEDISEKMREKLYARLECSEESV